jgi:hypothetical protein
MESDKAEKPPAETPPDHLSIDPKNSYYNEAILNPAAADSDADAVVKVTLNSHPARGMGARTGRTSSASSSSVVPSPLRGEVAHPFMRALDGTARAGAR